MNCAVFAKIVISQKWVLFPIGPGPWDKMGLVLRVFQSWKCSLILKLLKSLVIPLLEYCCQLWNPWKSKHTNYRSYSTNIYIQNHWSTALKLLKLYSLERRREHHIIIYIWKIKEHMVPTIDGTMGRTIKTRKHPGHGTQCIIKYPANRNPA